MTIIRRSRRTSPLGRALEPRMMFDGAAPVTAEVAATATEAPPPPAPAPATDAAAPATTTAPAAGVVREVTGAHQVVFIDGALDKANELAAAAPQDADVVLLDPGRDGIQQISEFLQSHTGLDAVHIVSHGDSGEITLGNTQLSDATLAEHAAELQQWGRNLAAGADVLIYGCDVAQGSTGQHFISEFASLTGTDVAASSDVTGAASYGGNWTLESTVGDVRTASVDFSTAGWDGELTSPTVYFASGFQLYTGDNNTAGTTTGGFDASKNIGWVEKDYFNYNSATGKYTGTISFTASASSTSTSGTFQGNDITGTLKFTGTFVDANGVTQSGTFSLVGALSRNNKVNGTVESLYFWSDTNNATNLRGLAFTLTLPSHESDYARTGATTAYKIQYPADNRFLDAVNQLLADEQAATQLVNLVADTGSITTGGTLTVDAANGVLQNDSAGHSLTITDVAAGAVTPIGNVGTSIAGTYGHLTMSSDGSYQYVADGTAVAAGASQTDTFTYAAFDGYGGFKTQTLTITVRGQGPSAVADTVAVTQGNTTTGNNTSVLANDTDSDSSTSKTVTGVVAGTATSAPTGNVTTSIAGTYGHLTMAADGTYSYAADIATGVSTTAVLTDRFTYTVTDGHGLTAYSTLTVSVTPVVPAAPSLSWNATVSGVEGSPVSLSSLAVTLSGSNVSLNTLTITGAPNGAIFSDGNNHSRASGGTSDVIDITGWDLSTLKVTPANDLNFTLSATATEKNAFNNVSAASTTVTEAVTVNPLTPTLTWTGTVSGIEGSTIALNTLTAAVRSLTGDTNSIATLSVTGAPNGTVLSDGTVAHTVTSDGTTAISIKGWNLSTLTVKPATAANFTLTVTATETDSEGNTSGQVTATEAVTVTPKAPTLSWAPTASGVKQTDVALGSLTASITNMGGETNSWNTLTISGAPNGVVLSDGTVAHTVTSDGTTPIDITGWTLSSLTAKSTTAQTFTLTVNAVEKDGDTTPDTSSQTTASEVVTISDAAVTAPTVTWTGPVAATEGAEVALPTLGYGITTLTDSLNTLTISGAPLGTQFKDGNGNTYTSQGTNDPVNVKGWDLSTLKIIPVNATNFTLTATATEKDGSGNVSTTATKDISVTVAPSAPTLSWAATASGVEGQDLSLGSLGKTITSRTGDNNTLATLTITGAPLGTILKDGSGHSYQSQGTTDAIDIKTWDLTTLKVVPVNAANFTLTATATEQDAEGNTSASITAQEAVTVNPTAPNVVWAPNVTGLAGNDIALGTLTAGITNRTGDTNSLDTLTVTGAPAGVVLTDGTNRVVSTGINHAIDVKGWNLAALKATSATAQVFTLRATATEKDAETNASTSASATDQVTVNAPPAAPVVTGQTTTSTTPTVAGTWDSSGDNRLTVTVNGHTYSVGDGYLTTNGNSWSLRISPDFALSRGTTYGVTATVTDTNNNSTSDTSANELKVDNPPQNTPAPVQQPVVLQPTPPQPPAPQPPVINPLPPAPPPPAVVIVTPPAVESTMTAPQTAAFTTQAADARAISMTFADGGPSTITDQNLQVQVASQSSSSSSNTSNNAIERQTFVIAAKELGQGSNPLVRIDAGLPKWMKIESQESGALKVAGDRPVGDTQTYRVVVKIKRATGEEANVVLEVAPTRADTQGAQRTQPRAPAQTGQTPDAPPAPADRRAAADGWLDQLLAAFDQSPTPDGAAAAGSPAGFIGQLAAEAQANQNKAAELAV